MLRVLLVVFALAGRCRGDAANSLSSPMLLLPPAPAPRRTAAAQAHSLRRQLMRDNYDYQHSLDEGQPNITAMSGGDTKFNYQKGGTDHLPRASELAQANSNEFSSKSGQKEHYQREQRGQHEQGRQYKQNGEYEHRHQYEQPGEHEQRGQYEQHDQYEHHGPHEQRGPHELRGQNEHSEQQEQFGQFDEQEQAQSTEQNPRTAASLAAAPGARAAADPLSDELPVRDVFQREHTPDWRDLETDQAKDYKPSYRTKRRDEYDPPYPAQVQRRPFSDLRGNYNDQYGQNDAGNDMRTQQELSSNAQESPDQEYTTDEQEAFDQQDASRSQVDEGSDFSVSKKQPKIYSNEFVTRRDAPPRRVRSSLAYHDNSPVLRSRTAAPPHRHVDHNISKKDLLYYMDDNQLRRRNNEASPDVPDEDQLPSPGPNNPAGTREPTRRPAPTQGSSGGSGGELPRTTRARRSFVVTVSATNVTYKLLTLKSRSGRRQRERRILEERGPAGVAIVSLDHAPLPAFRLPRVRRQYMHAPLHHRRHELA